MKAITDSDGILVFTETAKALRWFLAVMQHLGDLAGEGLTAELIDAIAGGEGRAPLKRIVDAHGEEIEKCVGFAGGKREDYAQRVWDAYRKGRGPVPEAVLVAAERIRPILLEWYSEPGSENLHFFKTLVATLSTVYPDFPLGLVTQSTMATQLKYVGWGEEFWGEGYYPMVCELHAYDRRIRGLNHVECAGDYKTRFPRSLDAGHEPKVVAYRLLCEKLAVRPGETIAFEDTADGVRASVAAGIACVGIKPHGSTQDLIRAGAAVEITGSLRRIEPLAEVFTWARPAEVVREIARLGIEGMRTGG